MCFLGCFFSSDTESAHDEKTDKPEKKPVKISTFFSSLLKGNKADADVEMAENKVSSAALYWVMFLDMFNFTGHPFRSIYKARLGR